MPKPKSSAGKRAKVEEPIPFDEALRRLVATPPKPRKSKKPKTPKTGA